MKWKSKKESSIKCYIRLMLYKTDVLQTTPYCYGKGFTYFLSYVLFQDEEPFNILEVKYKFTVY